MKNLIPIIAGTILGIIIWKFNNTSGEFGIGPLVFILICAAGGYYTWGKFK